MPRDKSATATKTKPKPAAAAAKKDTAAKPKRSPQACGCQCGSETKGGRFLPGHDARLKGVLLKQLREGDARGRAAAEKQLRAAGWDKFIPE